MSVDKYIVTFNDAAGLASHFQMMSRDTALVMAGRRLEEEGIDSTTIRLHKRVPVMYRPDKHELVMSVIVTNNEVKGNIVDKSPMAVELKTEAAEFDADLHAQMHKGSTA